MFGFSSKKDDLLGLHQKIGRFLNDTQYTRIEEEKQRSESRTRLALPCLLFLFKEADAPTNYAIGVTTDISLHGMGMIVQEKLESEEYIVVFGPPENRLVVKAVCRRAIPSHFGTFAHAFEFLKMLRAAEFPLLAQAVEMLDQSTNQANPQVTDPVALASKAPQPGLFSSMWQSIVAR